MGNASSVCPRAYLATNHSGRITVMGFRRWGTQEAQPVFPDNRRLTPLSALVKFDVGNEEVRGIDQAKADESVYRYDFSEVDSPVARLLASAPELYEACAEAAVNCRILEAEAQSLAESSARGAARVQHDEIRAQAREMAADYEARAERMARVAEACEAAMRLAHPERKAASAPATA